MELVLIFIVGVAVGDMHHKQDIEIDALKGQVSELENGFLRLAGSHSALSAREKVNDGLQKQQIDKIIKQVLNAPVVE